MLAEQVGCTRRLTAARDPQCSVEGERTMSLTYRHFSLIALVVLLAAAGTAAEVPAHLAEEFRVKRQGPFEFAEKPTITRDGDTVTIRFKTRAFCDVTIAVESKEVTAAMRGWDARAACADARNCLDAPPRQRCSSWLIVTLRLA
jgi:hypothetical protein